MKGVVVRIIVNAVIMVVGLAPSCPQAAEAVAPTSGMTPVLTLPRTGQISTYDQTGNLIDFQGSGQDGEFQRGVVWPDPRFIVNGDGTVSDSLTGLMWIKDANCFGDLPWPTAVQMVADFNKNTVSCHGLTTEYHDWFLPDVNQMATLFDAQGGVASDYLRLGGFIGVQGGVYWSATAYLNRLNAWGVNLTNGSIAPYNKLERHFLAIARVEKAERNVYAKVGGRSSTIGGEGTSAPPQPNQRFVDNGDGTVTDGWTGLMWLQDSSCLPKLDWQAALAVLRGEAGETSCTSVLRKYADWSMPNAIELRSLIDYETDYPALGLSHPFKAVAPGAGYWTANTVAAAPEQAFMVDFDTGAMLLAPKTATHRVLAVRQVVPVLDRPRKEVAKGVGLGVAERYLLALDPEMPSEIHWPPGPRFFNNGDGTSMDAITGTNWLTDANCLGKKSWKEAAETLGNFNSRPKAFKCAGYEAGVDDWQMPTLAEMSELVNKDEENSAAWLSEQGVKNVQNSAYWTATENPLNLYFADAITLKTGKAGNYPKSLKFFVWPKRKAQGEGKEPDEPLLNLTANAIGNVSTLSPKDPLSLVVYLHTFGLRLPADFWFWYDTPDEKRLWLTPIRTWSGQVTPVYQGPLFNLKNYEIYRTVANGLAPGVYDFHFAVDTIPNGILDEPHYEVKMSVVIPDGQ